MNEVRVDLSEEYPDILPGDTVIGVESTNGIVNALRVTRQDTVMSRFAFKELRLAGFTEAEAARMVPAVVLLAHSGGIA